MSDIVKTIENFGIIGIGFTLTVVSIFFNVDSFESMFRTRNVVKLIPKISITTAMFTMKCSKTELRAKRTTTRFSLIRRIALPGIGATLVSFLLSMKD